MGLKKREQLKLILLMNLVGRFSRCTVLRVSPTVGNLRSSIAEAVPGDVVILSAGTYQGAESCNLSITSSNITIIGEAGPSKTIIDCAEAFARQFSILGENITLEGLQLRGGTAVPNLTAVPSPSLPPQATDNDATFDPSAPYDTDMVCGEAEAACGGCAKVLGSGLVMRDLWFANCSARGGGGLYIDAVGRSVLVRLLVVNCSAAARGGGLLLAGSEAHLSESLVAGNTAPSGGGMYLSGAHGLPASLAAASVVFADNSAANGGALYLQGLTSAVIRGPGAFRANRASARGGAVMVAGGGGACVLEGAMRVEDNAAALGGAAFLSQALLNLSGGVGDESNTLCPRAGQLLERGARFVLFRQGLPRRRVRLPPQKGAQSNRERCGRGASETSRSSQPYKRDA